METWVVPSNDWIPSHVPAITHILISVSDYYLVPRQIFLLKIYNIIILRLYNIHLDHEWDAGEKGCGNDVGSWA